MLEPGTEQIAKATTLGLAGCGVCGREYLRLDRYDDRQIDLTQRLDRVATRELERGLERGIGLEL